MTEVIASSHNKHIKQLRHINSSAKARRESGDAIAHGIHLVASMLDSDIPPTLIIVAESAHKNDEVLGVLNDDRLQLIERITCKDPLYESFSDVHAAVGISAVFSMPTPIFPKPQHAPVQDLVLIDGIQDPGNIGTILRTAVGVGVTHVYVSPDSSSVWSPKALRAGMGAQFYATIYENCDLAALVQSLATPTIATMLSTRAESLYKADLSGPVAWVFGNEGKGVSDDLATICSQHIIIPQAHHTIESLNVSAAAAVCLYESYRQKIS